MDAMGSARKVFDSAPRVIVRTTGAPSRLPASAGAGQFSAAFFPSSAAAFAGMSPPFLGTPSTDIFLPGSYTRQIDPTTYHPLHYPYNMAIAKGSSFEAEGGAIKKPRTVFAPKQLLHLEEEFVKNQFPNMEQRKQIAKDLDLTQQHIQIWFQNRRAKKRRKKKRHSEEEKMRRDPDPPPFWPSNLPFSSNIGDLTKRIYSEGSRATASPASQVRNDTPSTNNDKDLPHLQTIECSPENDPHKKFAPHAALTLTEKRNNDDSGNTRPSHLQCNSQDSPLKSPALALTPGNGHSQLPTPPPYISPVTTHPELGNFAGSPVVSMMSHASSSDVVLTPPSDLSLQNYPPLPPPESLLTGSFHIEPGGYFVNPLCEGTSLHNLHSLSARPRGATSVIPPPPPYSSLTSCNIVMSSQISYTMEYPTTTTSAFVDPLSLKILPMHPYTKPVLLPTSETATLLTSGGPSSVSPALSPITNSDCSLADTSPLMQDVALPAPPDFPSERNFTSTSSAMSRRTRDNLSIQIKGPSLIDTTLNSLQSASSPIHATDPVALTDLQEKDWELFSNSLCPVIQTDHDTWAPQLPPSTFSNKAGPGASISGSSSTRYAATCEVGYTPYSIGNTQSYPVSSVSNGAK